ncbi:hypothetical protein ACWNT8_01660 [Pigmentibacter ruber]|nr:hypothetical protein GTC16762_05620 [Pigmentibacter ruber]
MKNINYTFYFTLIAYKLFIENKKNNKFQNEQEFYSNFVTELFNEKIDFILPNLSDIFTDELLQNAKILCDFEALTFLPEESKNDREKHNQIVKDLFQKIIENSLFVKYNFDNLIFENWRIFIGMYVTFHEWCENIEFYNADKAIQQTLLKESPLISFNQF